MTLAVKVRELEKRVGELERKDANSLESLNDLGGVIMYYRGRAITDPHEASKLRFDDIMWRVSRD